MNTNAQNNEGNTPLHICILCQTPQSNEIIRYLIYNGALIETFNNSGDTPLLLAYR